MTGLLLNPRIRNYLALIISLIPSSKSKVYLYNRLLGYRIDPTVRVGLLTRIIVEQAVIEKDCTLGRYNTIRGPLTLEIGAGTVIGEGNRIECGEWAAEGRFKEQEYLRTCRIERKAQITSHHFLDATGGLFLGENSWIAGMGSQFWTHGLGAADRAIRIGRNCYIGSAARFAPGSEIADHNIVALGSVVSGKFGDEKQLIAGVPAKAVKDIAQDLENETFRWLTPY